jgi:hypothetical protein
VIWKDRADVYTQGGADPVAEGLKCSIWPAGKRTTRTGAAYDWTGQAQLADQAELVGKANRTLLIDGTRYKLIEALPMTILPHVELRLLEVRPAG